jgi:hypothetical protein
MKSSIPIEAIADRTYMTIYGNGCIRLVDGRADPPVQRTTGTPLGRTGLFLGTHCDCQSFPVLSGVFFFKSEALVYLS